MTGPEIKALRLARKLTQDGLGELCGVTKASVSRWENDKDTPRGSAMKILSQLASGDLVVSQVSELEVKLLDQNVEVGNFRNKEDYLTASLKHLLMHGKFMDMEGPRLRVADDETPSGVKEEGEGGE